MDLQSTTILQVLATSSRRVKKLEALHGWSWSPRHDDWETSYSSLRAWLQQNRLYPSRDSKDRNEKTLANWVKKQRQAYTKSYDMNLSESRVKALLELRNWTFPAPTVCWAKMFAALRHHTKTKNNLPSPLATVRWKKQWLPIGAWFFAQRGGNRIYKLGTVSQMEALEKWQRSLKED